MVRQTHRRPETSASRWHYLVELVTICLLAMTATHMRSLSRPATPPQAPDDLMLVVPSWSQHRVLLTNLVSSSLPKHRLRFTVDAVPARSVSCVTVAHCGMLGASVLTARACVTKRIPVARDMPEMSHCVKLLDCSLHSNRSPCVCHDALSVCALANCRNVADTLTVRLLSRTWQMRTCFLSSGFMHE